MFYYSSTSSRGSVHLFFSLLSFHSQDSVIFINLYPISLLLSSVSFIMLLSHALSVFNLNFLFYFSVLTFPLHPLCFLYICEAF